MESDHPKIRFGKTGVLLINLGTPNSTSWWDIRKYLKEFLSDRRVIEINPIIWQIILNLFILTFRPSKTAHAYKKIWKKDTNESPLLYYTRSQAEKLKKLLRKKSNLKHMMGYQLKFNPIILKLKDLLSKKIIGDIYYVNIHHGEHINDFHPYENYKHSYAAKKSLGGGVVLTQIHEIDYMLYLFDNYKVITKSSISTKVSDLQIDVEDTLSAQFILRDRKRNLICQLHTNFYEKPKRRQINIIGKKGKIFCDLNKGIINVFRNGKERKILFNFDRNKIFMKQVKYFLNCIKKNKKVSSKLDVISGAKSLELALKLK